MTYKICLNAYSVTLFYDSILDLSNSRFTYSTCLQFILEDIYQNPPINLKQRVLAGRKLNQQ
jgi:hypothetical protein